MVNVAGINDESVFCNDADSHTKALTRHGRFTQQHAEINEYHNKTFDAILKLLDLRDSNKKKAMTIPNKKAIQSSMVCKLTYAFHFN